MPILTNKQKIERDQARNDVKKHVRPKSSSMSTRAMMKKMARKTIIAANVYAQSRGIVHEQ